MTESESNPFFGNMNRPFFIDPPKPFFEKQPPTPDPLQEIRELRDRMEKEELSKGRAVVIDNHSPKTERYLENVLLGYSRSYYRLCEMNRNLQDILILLRGETTEKSDKPYYPMSPGTLGVLNHSNEMISVELNELEEIINELNSLL